MSITKEQVLAILRSHEAELQSHGIRHAALFGSVARGEQGPDSDIDILIELEPDDKRSVYGYVGLTRVVAELFSVPVDVVDKWHLKPDLVDDVSADAIYVF